MGLRRVDPSIEGVVVEGNRGEGSSYGRGDIGDSF